MIFFNFKELDFAKINNQLKNYFNNNKMACCQQNACGLPSIPRFAFPTMFEILSWSAAGQSNIPES